MSLQELIARLGLTEVARRAGVSPETLRRWLTRGPSGKGANALAGVIRRHLAGRKAAETKRQGEVFRGGLTTPPETELPEKVVKPKAPPSSPAIEGEGSTPFETDRYTGEIHVMTIGQPVTDVDFDGLARLAARIFTNSGRDYVRTRFLLFRYVTPGSPGKGGMVSKHGKWSEFWYSTHDHASASAFENEVRHLQDETSEMRSESLRDLANRRIIWLEQVHIHTYDDTETPTKLATIVTRELR
jgi:hypothetical protein